MKRVLSEVLVATMVAGVIWWGYRTLQREKADRQQCINTCLEAHVCQSSWACSKTCDK